MRPGPIPGRALLFSVLTFFFLFSLSSRLLFSLIFTFTSGQALRGNGPLYESTIENSIGVGLLPLGSASTCYNSWKMILVFSICSMLPRDRSHDDMITNRVAWGVEFTANPSTFEKHCPTASIWRRNLVTVEATSYKTFIIIQPCKRVEVFTCVKDVKRSHYSWFFSTITCGFNRRLSLNCCSSDWRENPWNLGYSTLKNLF